MGYVDSNLMPGEKVVYKGNIHWFIFLPGLIGCLIGTILFIAAIFFLTSGEIGVGGIIFLFIGIASLIKAFIEKHSTELAVTSKRVIAKKGFIKRNTIELNHSKVESFNVDQSILGRLFDFGTLVINGTGGGKTPVRKVDSPLEFRRNALKVIDSQSGSI